MKIFIASDHAGFHYKDELIKFLKDLGNDVVDRGAFKYDESDDYPDFISLVAKDISDNPNENKGIILGGSGQGEAIVANRYKNVRAVVCYGGDIEKIITLSREHNNSNVLSIGARFIDMDDTKKAVKLWLETPFRNEERHLRRIKKIENND